MTIFYSIFTFHPFSSRFSVTHRINLLFTVISIFQRTILITFVLYNCTGQIYKHFKQNKQLCLKLLMHVVIFIQSK